MKTKKVTKKAINLAIKSKNKTELFRLAKLSGVDVSRKSLVFDFIYNNCKYSKRHSIAYQLAFCSEKRYFYIPEPILIVKNSIEIAKRQDKNSPYCKILIKGNNNWYWASPVYLHSDYNKGIAFPINDFNNRLAYLLNKLILNNGKTL